MQKKIIIIGGGFGGLTLAKALLKKKFQVTLLDRNNYHCFLPLLYQVATGGLEADSITSPIRKVFRKQRNVEFRLAEVFGINPAKNIVKTSIGEMAYDYIVIAAGSRTNFFSLENQKQHIIPLKDISDAMNLRNIILQKLENAHLAERTTMNIVIAGGGPTGVELAGALAEMKRYVMTKDYPEVDFNCMHIYLLEGDNRLLRTMSEKSSQRGLYYLQELGVDVILNAKVSNYDGKRVIYNQKEEILTDTFIWSAGVKGESFTGIPENNLTSNQRIKVDEFNRVAGFSNVFAIGDIAAIINKEIPNGLPMVAPVAMQQAKLLAKNLQRISCNKELIPFNYKDKGTMATVGRNRAVVDFGTVKFRGRFAWIVWLVIHLLSLIGFRNRLVVLIDWIYNYFTYDRTMCLIRRNDKDK